MKRIILASLLVFATTAVSNATLLVQELFDGAAGDVPITGLGDTPTSIGFDPADVWSMLDAPASGGLYIAANFDTPRSYNPQDAPTNMAPQRLAVDGGIWFSLGTTPPVTNNVHAVRLLASTNYINTGADGVYYMTFNHRNQGQDFGGMGLCGNTNNGSFVSVGFTSDNATNINGVACGNSFYIAQGTLSDANGGPYGILTNTTPGGVSYVPHVVLVKLTTLASGNDEIKAAFFDRLNPGRGMIPTNEAQVVWDLVHSFNSSDTYSNLLAFMKGGDWSAELDSIRLGTDYYDVILASAPTNASVTASPASTVFAGTPVTMSVSATGTQPWTSYQWLWSTNNGVITNTYVLADETNATLVLSNPLTNNSGDYSVILGNIFGSTTSSVVTLTVNPVSAPVITAAPATVSIFPGANATFTVTADGTPPLRYQWQHAYTNLVGETNTILYLNTPDTNKAGYYTIIVTNNYGTATADAILDFTADPYSEGVMVRECFDGGYAWGSMQSRVIGDNTSSLGFDVRTNWTANSGVQYINMNTWDNIATGTRGAVPGWPITVSGTVCGIYGDPNVSPNTGNYWAARKLSPANYINFAAEGVHYLSAVVHTPWNCTAGIGLISGNTTNDTFVSIGAASGGGYVAGAGNTDFIAQGTLGAELYTADAAGPALNVGGWNGTGADSPGLLVGRLVTRAGGIGNTLSVKWYLNGTTVKAPNAADAWDATYTFNSSMTATHLLMFARGSWGSAVVDGIRVGRTYYSVAMMPWLDIQNTGSGNVITWETGTLQQADQVDGTFTDVVGATSPYPVPAGAQKFYRVYRVWGQ